jgi:hypothetical protein
MFPVKFIFLLAGIFIQLISFSQSKEEQIRLIRKEFQLINSSGTLKKCVLQQEAFTEHSTDGGSELTGYYQKGKIRKIVLWIGLSNGIHITEYYFRNGELIFIYKQFEMFTYDEQKEELNYHKREKTFEGRYYFHKNKLIHQQLKGDPWMEEATTDPEKQLIGDAEEWKQKLVGCL